MFEDQETGKVGKPGILKTKSHKVVKIQNKIKIRFDMEGAKLIPQEKDMINVFRKQ
jgi:hypothetical protein